MSASIKGHAVILPIAGWGHIRPATHLALSLLEQSDELVVTFIPDRRSAKRIKQELSAYRETFEPLKERLQILPLVKPQGPELPDSEQDAIREEATNALPDTLDKLFGVKEGIFRLPPKTFIMDPLAGPPSFQLVREGVERCKVQDVRILGLFLLSTPFVKQFFDETMEMKNAKDEETRQALEKRNADLDHLITSMDLPPITVGQAHPQIGGGRFTPQFLGMMRTKLAPIFDDCYGIVDGGTPELEPESTGSFTELTGLKLYPVGVSPRQTSALEEIPEMMNNDRFPTDSGGVKKFMDESLERYGEKSVAYVSFGSVCWPRASPEMVDWLFTTLLEVKPEMPVLIGLAPADAELSVELQKRLKESGRTFLCSWVPQRAVLAHPAMGFYVSHCGAGSSSEAAMAGVPIVAVPQFGDQPAAAATLMKHGCATQLFEFNNGLIGHKLHNGIVIKGTEEAVKGEMRKTWEDMKGEKGEEMRKNMKKLGDTLRKSHESGGARKGIDSLCKLIIRD